MAANDRSRNAKRKAKRSGKQQPAEPLPYSGRKYQAECWVPHVYETEQAIYEAIKLSGRRLTNEQVRKALINLILQLRRGSAAPLPEGEPEVQFAAGQEVEFLMWNIRRHWRLLFEDEGPTSSNDLIGILRTLLNSIEVHGWNTGRSRGYVDFLVGFFERGQVPRVRLFRSW